MRKNKYLTPWTNSMLIFSRKATIGQHRCQTVFIVGDEVCAHLGRDVGPLLPAESPNHSGSEAGAWQLEF